MQILFITHSSIGDVVLSTGLMNRLLEQYPHAAFDIVVGHRAASLFEAFPNLGELVVVQKKRYGLHHLDLFRRLRHKHYDIIVDLRTPLLGRLLRGHKKLVFNPRKTPDAHKAEQMAALWDNGGQDTIKLSVWPSPENTMQAAKVLGKSRGVIVLAPTANWVGKQWPQKNWAILCDMLEEHSPTPLQYVVLGAEHERASVADFIATLPTERTLDLVGHTSVLEAYGYITKATLFVGNDSGLGHMAAAAGIPMLTLFGPTLDNHYRPWSDKATVIAAPRRPRNEVTINPRYLPRVMTDITPKMVFDAILPILKKNEKAA